MIRTFAATIRPRWAAVLLAILLLAGPAWAAETNKFALGLGFEFASGDYGTDTTTRSVRVPLTFDYAPTDRLDFELVVPFLYQSNGNVIITGGGGMGVGRGRGTTGQTTGTASSDSQSGLGDTTLTAGYVVVTETASRPAVRPLLYLKFPTGDKDKSLGTGEFDVGAGLGLSKWFGSWYSFAEGRYILQGSNAELGLKDYATFEAEGGYLVSRRFLPTIDVWWSSATTDAGSDQAELRLKGKYWLSNTLRLEPYLGKGLTNQSANYGAGLALFYFF